MSENMDFPGTRDLLGTARKSFAQFYLLATPTDESLMDGLVMAHAALVVGMNAPRGHVAPVVRGALEKGTDAAERVFTELREAVRACPTFSALIATERAQIERDVFEVKQP